MQWLHVRTHWQLGQADSDNEDDKKAVGVQIYKRPGVACRSMGQRRGTTAIPAAAILTVTRRVETPLQCVSPLENALLPSEVFSRVTAVLQF